MRGCAAQGESCGYRAGDRGEEMQRVRAVARADTIGVRRCAAHRESWWLGLALFV